MSLPTINNVNDQEGTAISQPSSPTGAPVIPTGVVPWLVGIVAVAGTLSEVLPEHTIAANVCRFVFFLGSALGLVSPGLRKK